MVGTKQGLLLVSQPRISKVLFCIKNFEKKIFNFLSLNKISVVDYSAEPKIDGISASLIYINGKLTKLLINKASKNHNQLSFSQTVGSILIQYTKKFHSITGLPSLSLTMANS